MTLPVFCRRHGLLLRCYRSRRGFLKRAGTAAAAIGGVAVLGGCSVQTTGGVTTISLKVDEAVGDIKIAESVAQTVLSFTAVPTPVTTVVSKAVALINGGLDAFQQYAGSTATLTFDSTSVPAALTSVVADIRTAASDISGAATGIEATLAAKVSTVSADVAAVASVIESMFSAVTSARFGLSEVEWRKQRIAAIRLRHGV